MGFLKIGISFLLSLFLFSNFVLAITNSSLCHMEGCELASSILIIDNSILYGTGFLFFLILTHFFVRERQLTKEDKINIIGISDVFKNSIAKRYTKAIKIMITVALVFETTMLSFLIISTGSICLVCLITFISVLILYILSFSWDKSLLIVLPVAIALSLLETTNTKAIDFEDKKYILFQSEECKHCVNTKKFLDNEHIEYKKINAKQEKDLLNTLGIKTIPVLLEQKDDGFSITTGEQNIKNLFKKESHLNFIEVKSLSNDDGCNLNKPVCDD